MSDNLQPALFDVEDDSALLFSFDEIKKRYTGKQAAEIERLREAVLMLLPFFPVERIADRLHLSRKTIVALAAQDAEKVSAFKRESGEMLVRHGFRCIALARTKEDEASYKDLHIAAGIAIDKGLAIAQIGQIEEVKELQDEQDHVQAAEALRRLMEHNAPEQPIDPPSV